MVRNNEIATTIGNVVAEITGSAIELASFMYYLLVALGQMADPRGCYAGVPFSDDRWLGNLYPYMGKRFDFFDVDPSIRCAPDTVMLAYTYKKGDTRARLCLHADWPANVEPLREFLAYHAPGLTMHVFAANPETGEFVSDVPGYALLHLDADEDPQPTAFAFPEGESLLGPEELITAYMAHVAGVDEALDFGAVNEAFAATGAGTAYRFVPAGAAAGANPPRNPRLP